MSKVLSIYNAWAFCEVVLPPNANTEFTFLLDSELFKLHSNRLIELENVKGQWIFKNKPGELVIKSNKDSMPGDKVVFAPGLYSISIPHEEKLTIIAEERNDPLAVYEKYKFTGNTQITVGGESDNTLVYKYHAEDGSSGFVSRHQCVIRTDGVVAELEDGDPRIGKPSANGTFVNNIRVTGKRILNYGDSIRVFGLNIIYLGDILAINTPANLENKLVPLTEAQVTGMAAAPEKEGSSKKRLFFRAPRTVPKFNTDPIEIDSPPTPKEPPKMPLFMQIGPSVTMAIPMLLSGVMMIMSYNQSGSAVSPMMFTGLFTAIASAGLATFWAITNLRYNKKVIREGEERRFEKYGSYLIEKQNEIEKIYNKDSEAFRQKYISSDEIANYDADCEKMWNRNFNHSDVLSYRLGLGNLPFPAPISVPKSKFTMVEDALAEKPQLIKDRFSVMRNVPVCVDFKDQSLVGIIGENNTWAQVVKNLIVQIAGNNSYTDVKIAFVYDSDKISNSKSWEFVKWLPHTWSEDKRVRFYATNKNEASEVFYSLGQTIRTRSEDEKSSTRPYYILFVLNKELLEGELLSKYIGDGSSDLGISTIIAADKYEGLPNTCEFIIENNVAFTGIYNTIDEHMEKLNVVFDSVSDEKLISFAKRLANIEIDEAENGGEVPPSISFFDMYGISRPEELAAEERWRKSKTAETMKAIIGFKNGKSPCYLDIHERYHGPHGLVAGTTGSGKSETLQTYMLSLAINYSPDDIGFFIIDYKGGGMANLFEGLPHIIGAISNLSGNQVKRAMVSIKSENKRRQRVFSDYGVNNINAYTSLYKNGDAKEPIPHMFIIIDEFAELKREEPDFMRELVSVAQVGRSLGVHLILATQKPAGTVDDNIWSNSKFRLCLRVQDRQDSMDMLHRAEAAYITQAGRGYLQVGNDEIFELFQSGYSGATYDESLGNKKLVVAQMLDPVGKVDLVGNHFKIQHQEDVLRKWITVLYNSVLKALGGKYKGRRVDDELLFDAAFISEIYHGIAEQGVDFKPGQYNDVRLREFVKLVSTLGENKGNDFIRHIRETATERGVKLPELKNKTQLEAVKEYLAQVALTNGYTREISLWMPVLPSFMLLTDIAGYKDQSFVKKDADTRSAKWTLSAIIGKGDDPENQNQMPISIDFGAGGHHAVCGTVSTGKSTLLQTTIFSLISKYSCEELNLYLIDFSAKLLTIFADSKHVGGIMTEAEEDAEKISKFFTMMSSIIDQRKKTLASTNFRDYVEHSGKTMPAIVIVIDNYAAFKEKTDEKYDDVMRQLAKDGISYGIFLLVSAGGFGANEIPLRLADNFRTTICLEMSDIYQYSDVMRVVKSPIYPESNTKGRGLVYYGEKIIEFQTALAAPGESMFERNDNIKNAIDRINSLNTGKPAKRIPIIPEKPMWEDYVQQEDYQALIDTKNLVPNGYDAETAAYSSIDLTSLLTYVISGTKKSGKSTYMKTLIRAFADKDSEVCIMEIGTKDFEQLAQTVGCRYITDGAGIYDYAKNVLLAEVSKRAPKKTECLGKHLDDADFFDEMLEFKRHCIFIPNIRGFINELYNRESEAYNAVNVYETLVGDKGYHYNYYFFAEVGDADISEVLGYKFMQSFKDNGKGIRFGGKYLAQKLFTYANIPYKVQNNALKPGMAVVPTDDESARVEQIVAPNYKG